jgi:NAD(P)-dependent dehydrogenase (short-subunit alcohol dehydrogenase family)
MTALKDFDIGGKVAIVTGAGRGIGKVITLTMAEAGADVVLVARTREQIEKTAQEVRKLGRKALAIPTDVTQEDQVKSMVEQTISEFGKIDILVNNAGFYTQKPVTTIPGTKIQGLPGTQPTEDTLTLEDWHLVMETNLTSVFLLCRAIGPHMMKQRKGKVINISSTNAYKGTPGVSVYSASKGGLNLLTQCLASEWAPFNINVNGVSPGSFKTAMSEHFLEDSEGLKLRLEAIPLGRLGELREIALTIIFLASEASSYMTGQTLLIDGGQMAHGPGV